MKREESDRKTAFRAESDIAPEQAAGEDADLRTAFTRSRIHIPTPPGTRRHLRRAAARRNPCRISPAARTPPDKKPADKKPPGTCESIHGPRSAAR